MLNLGEIRNQLREHLDDVDGTGFNTTKLTALINNALQWVVTLSTNHHYFYRWIETQLSIVSGTSEYILELPNVRHIIQVEEYDATAKKRVKGTLIDFQQRNDVNTFWHAPVLYEKFKEKTGTSSYFKHLVFARLTEPNRAFTLLVTWAPAIQLFAIGDPDTKPVIDIHPDLENLLVLRATIQGYGGEKQADTFWMTQYIDAYNLGVEFLSTTKNKDEVQFVRQINEPIRIFPDDIAY